jgi:rRNA maturation RNase YbeY
LVSWIEQVIKEKGGKTGEINYIFCSDAYLHKMNVDYLQHDTLTDIITFPSADFPLISGDLFISTERVADNATDFGEAYDDELHRVMIHGILHLCGQSDKTEAEAQSMRELEQWALSLRPSTL